MKQGTFLLDVTFKAKLYILLSIAVLFIAIIPAKVISGIFSNDATIFIVSLVGFTVLLEFVAWYFLSLPMEIYDSIIAKKATCEELPFETEQPKTEIIEEQEGLLSMTEEKEENKGNITQTSIIDLYKKGCDDYYEKQAEFKKEQLDKIAEYIHYIMAPFIKQENLECFCNEIMSFAINPDYVPKPFVGLKGTLTSFDIRHLIWNITSRLGLGRGKQYSVELCINFIRTMFPDLCKDLDYSTLKNLRVTSTTDKIHIDEPGNDGISFHIPQTIR